jgi:hypothetical protein
MFKLIKYVQLVTKLNILLSLYSYTLIDHKASSGKKGAKHKQKFIYYSELIV